MNNIKKRICYICETPYQVYNSINLYACMRKEATADIYIGKIFSGADELIDRMKKSGIFEAVYSYSDFNRSAFMRFQELFFPHVYIDCALELGNITKVDYDTIFMSSATFFSMAMAVHYRKAKIIYYDDGLGSYIGTVGIKSIAPKRLLCYKLAGKRPERFKNSETFLYRPELFINQENIILRKMFVSSLMKNDEDYNRKINLIFPYKYDDLYSKKIIYLANPSQDDTGEKVHKIEKFLLEYGDNVTVRLHPREVNPGYFQIVNVSNNNAQWELIAQNQINEQQILIGIFSTAQAIPKMLFDKEPYIIFTLKLSSYATQNKLRILFINFIEKLKSIYKQPEKICVPNNIEELKDFIQKALTI